MQGSNTVASLHFYMEQLNLPECELRLCKNDEDKTISVYDILRQKFVALTPEEWVRQHFVHFLIDEKKYPQSFMANEVAIRLNGTSRRCDTVVYDRHCKPLMIIEYKATDVNITQAVFDQIVRYNMVLKVKYLVVSNGKNHYICQIDYDTKKYAFLKDIPEYSAL